MFRQAEVTARAQSVQVDKATTDTLDALPHELIGGCSLAIITEKCCVDLEHSVSDSADRITPGPSRVGICKQGIDTRGVAMLVFEQPVGYAGISGNHEDAAVHRFRTPPCNEHVCKQGIDVHHRGAANLLHRM